MSKSQKIEIIRHSLSHVLAAAVYEMFPDARFAIGPAIENGFYYDFDLPRTLIPEDLEILEEKMRNIIKANYQFKKADIKADEALKSFKKAGQNYKVELIKDFQKETKNKMLHVTCYMIHDFVDLCVGPHLDSTGEINTGSFKLTKISGAYWKGSEKNKMLQRIYGIAFESPKKLRQYLAMIEEAGKRDHRKLGKELDLFCFSDLVGPGLPLFTPKGTIIKRTLERWIEDEEAKRDYLQTSTPDIARVALYEKSGHWQHYKSDMYPAMEIYADKYVLRPMTCPHQFMIYNSRKRSYRELPLRYSEISRLYRREKSGELYGLIRHAGGWSFADAHIMCTAEQVEEEFEKVVDLIQYVMKSLGITEYWYRFSKWDPRNKGDKYVNDPKSWNLTQKSMKKIIDKMKLDYEEVEGEAAFYGPKLDVQLRNINGKSETAFTVQIDFALAEKFDMVYTDKNGKEKRPTIIHRSSIGCLERTMAFLIEKYAGAFPLWLSPVQTEIIPVSEKFEKYGKEILAKLKEKSIRAAMNDTGESLGKRIREAQNQKINYMLIVGEKEMKAKTVAVRDREKGDLGAMKIDKFLEKIGIEIENKK